ncbi:Uncharacterised protein [Mycobacteroides abscessus subsp. abscessus]|nr:Uncharacterised protein [Mycobacteroides abscessus subsp. abscessus]
MPQETGRNRRGSGKVTATELLQMLRQHHGLNAPPEKWAGGTLVHEVSANGPHGEGRRADALYIGYTAASGRCLIGYEIKTSRADWRREIALAANKADQWCDQCHEWWIVVSDPAIVKDGELPQGWGLMSPPSGGDHLMTVHVRAERNTDRNPSWDTLRSIMSRLETLRAQTIEKQLWHIKQETRREVHAEIEAEYAKKRGPDTAELHRRLQMIQDALGVRFDWGDAANRAFRAVDPAALAQLGSVIKEYGGIANAVEAISDRFRPSIAAMRSQLQYLEKELDQLTEAGAVSTEVRQQTA